MDITPNNFIEQAVIDDIKEKHLTEIVTRFPPEPNGYLHIGHCKAICIDFLTAQKFGGYTNLRLDDTNPAKEDEEYVKSIQEDIKWLGFNWKNVFYASDYYDFLYDCAIDLIKQGKAYVCDLNADEVNATRGTLTEPGKESPYRNRSIDENLDLLARMRAGEFKDGEKTLRAKIDMANPNINMRDPIMYRILHTTHYRQGNKWCIYPMYDFAHPLSDAKEGITHSLCSLEFEDHRPLYNWFVENCSLIKPPYPRQIEFSRLHIDGTVLSKRYLQELVKEKYVDGWDDPRMPTLSAFRRKGYPAEAIKEFCSRIGVAKSNSLIQPHILEACVRECLNANAVRVVGVLHPLKVVLTNYPEDKTEEFMISNNPTVENAPKHPVTFSKELYIEQEDFMEFPEGKFHRLKPDGVVRLMSAYIIKCDEIIKNEDGSIKELHCSVIYDAEAQGIKAKGTIHWLSCKHAIPCKTRKFFNLLKEGETYQKGMLDKIINPNSLEVNDSYVEPFALTFDNAMQFVRMGYYVKDKTSTNDCPVFNETVSLKESK